MPSSPIKSNGARKRRLYYLDFLKTVGLFCIIIAHVNPPNCIIAVRSFDVPLMVIISSFLANRSYKKYKATNNGIIGYYRSRFARLVFPTWLFFVLYFAVTDIGTGHLHPASYYLKSFLLTRYGVDYVWIILIYLYSALLVPIIERIGFSIKAIVTVILFYLAYEILYHFQIGTNNMAIETTFYYIIPYGLLTYIGYNLEKIKRKKLIIFIVANLIIFIATALYLHARTGNFQQIQTYKYPPRLYYLSYGIFCSLSLMTICKNKRYEKYFNNKIIQYISSHSMWIYLWHALALFIYQKLHLPENWILKFLAVSISAILIVILVNKFLDKLEKRKHIKLFDYLRG